MFNVRFEGGEKLAATLGQLSRRLSRRLQTNALLSAGEPMRARVSSGAPREPGEPDLADHIVLAPRRATGDDVSVGIGPDSRAFFYDWFNEFGTSKQGARPFYRPAFDSEAPRVIGRVGQELWAALVSGGVGSARVPQGPSESFGLDDGPDVSGGPFGGLL